MRTKGSDGELIKFDVGSGTDIEAVLGGWIEKNEDKPIEVLVNNAGVRQDVLLMWMKAEEWHNVLNPTLDGFFYVTRLIIKSMLMKKYGRIINVVSLSGIKGMPGQTNYSAAKAGIIGATIGG